MATSSGITNIRATRTGHRILYSADYAHTEGAAHETMDVAAGRLISAVLNPIGTINSQKVDGAGASVTSSTSGAVQTLTFNNNAGITAGTVSVVVELA